MLPYRFSSEVLIRFPAYSAEDYNTGNLQALLDAPFFRQAIYFASRELYQAAETKNFTCASMNVRTRESLLKYYNRMCYRPTPFGLFSGTGCASWSATDHGLRISREEKLTLQADFRLCATMGEKLDRQARPSDTMLYYASSSLYTFGKELRYMRSGRETEGIAAVDKSAILSGLLKKCRNGLTCREILALLEEHTGEEAGSVLDALIAEELIHTALRPNVTGESYLNRLLTISGDKAVQKFADQLERIHLSSDLEVEALEKLAGSFLLPAERLKHPYYVNYQRKIEGSVDVKYQNNILEGLHCLGKLQQSPDTGAIARFRAEFTRRFEDREIPLMLALDPEAGIGYEQLAQPADGGELLNGISFTGNAAEKQILWGPVQELLLKKICKRRPAAGVITLIDQDLAGLPETKKLKYPPGISVMFRLHEEKVFIEEAGGACATALLGRFTPFNGDLLDLARDAAEKEADMNPGVVFAEISHFADEHAANINVREHIRKFEIPVLVHSTLPAEQVIGLDELYLSVRGYELILRSSRLNKRVIPRLSSAYNYQRSDVPVFRFLCDLQYQGLAARFSLDLRALLPGLNFYPRLEYKGCILSPEMWLIDRDEIQALLNEEDGHNAFLQLKEERDVCRFFALSKGDRQLVFDSEDRDAINLFLTEIANEKSVLIKEFFIPEQRKAFLKDNFGHAYVHQVVAVLTCTEASYTARPFRPCVPAKARREFGPGDEWLYFKMYCAPQNANYILSQKVFPLIRKHIRSGDISEWFFIRYYDPDHHLRIRIKAGETLISQLPGMFSKLLKPLCRSGMISCIVIDTYKRELERYGTKAIGLAEKAFMSSSEWVMYHLSRGGSEFETISFAIYSTDILLTEFGIAAAERLQLLENICRSLMNELGDEKQLREDLNLKYREHQQGIWLTMGRQTGMSAVAEVDTIKVFRDDLSALAVTLHKYEPSSLRRYAGDMLHMHMNRIFNTEQRKKELVIYYLTLRYYLTLKARTTRQPVRV